jgi:Arylsulfotransferase (ASST)
MRRLAPATAVSIGALCLAGGAWASAHSAATAGAVPTVAISPLSGTRDASPQTQISFLGVAASEIRDVSVRGSRSGAHAGRLQSYATATGASFLPSKPFTEGEQVAVSALIGPSTGARRVTSNFTIARLASIPLGPSGSAAAAQGSFSVATTKSAAKASRAHAATTPKPGTVQSFVSEPSVLPSTVTVTVNSPAAAPGDVFLTFNHGYGQPGEMITDGAGRLVWFKPAPKGDIAMDLHVQEYHGSPALVWWQGHISSLGVGFGEDEIYDSSYRPIAQITGGNGYRADLHEVQLTPSGSAFITAYTAVDADLSSAGGSRNGVLLDSVLQEIDVPTGLVMFEWHAYGHVPLSDSFWRLPSSASEPWDFFHINSYSPAPNGTLLVSGRNTWAAYDLNPTTGAVEWRWNGKKSSFKGGAGTGMAWQHDVRWQPDGTITAFDDGAVPKVHSQSRAIRVRLDFKHRIAKLVGRFVHTPSLLAGSQGSVQVLPNGDSFVGWGSEPYFTEFSPTGQVVFDGHIPYPGQSYRTFRFPWTATPSYAPAIAVKSGPSAGHVTVYASWNGATTVARWRVLAGPSPTKLSAVLTAPTAGFETQIALASREPAFAVQALDGEGNVLATSAATGPQVQARAARRR